ncbi:MAG TPA: hypothetical protein VMT62_03420 [Syntrophorhabdaceae bacterium]|nr:hypothetical protein [Syntrophorhabdaceae bacterium]
MDDCILTYIDGELTITKPDHPNVILHPVEKQRLLKIIYRAVLKALSDE